MTELLSGECIVNANRSANLLRSRFYVCPICGNVIWSAGEGAFSCCGVRLPPLEAETPDEEHPLRAERVESEWYVTVDHPMTKDHYIRFLAFITDDRAQIIRLYPEQSVQARFFPQGRGMLYACCNRNGLFARRIG